MKVILQVEGMHCEGCVTRIKNVIENIKGLQDISINLEKKEVVLEVKNEKVLEQIKEKIENLGFKVEK